MGSRHPSISPFEALPTSNGHIVVAAGNDGLFRLLCRSLGCEELGRDSRFAHNEQRRENAEALSAALGQALAAHTSEHWIEVLGRAGIPCGPLNDVSQVVSDPQVLARQMIVSTRDAAGNELKMAGNPVKLVGHADPGTRDRAPALDADRQAILAELADD
jgi:CoA:oxalate CoA-transferase